jgi:protein-S-isoprenylcysteine O-methyltransferase Ste14
MLTLTGLLLTVWARVHLGANWSGTIQVKQHHELITSGPYRFVRHPIYSGLLQYAARVPALVPFIR